MTTYDWDADLAVMYGPLDEDLEGRPSVDRYGVTEREELAGEPLAVALAQEEPDAVVAEYRSAEYRSDDPWVFVDMDWDAEARLLAGADARDPEEAAMHLELR